MTLVSTISLSPVTNRASMRASAAPDRTIIGSARPPTTRSSASTSIVLPAPVSPVMAVRPPPSTRSMRRITPRSSMWSSESTVGIYLTIGQAELGLEDLVVPVGAEAHEAGRLVGGAAAHTVARFDRQHEPAIDRDLGAAVTGDLDLH